MLITYNDLDMEILGHGTALPEGPAVSNFDLLSAHPDTKGKPEAMLREFSERIAVQYGFSERYLSRWPGAAAKPGEPSSESLIASAVKQALGPNGKPSAFVLGTTTSRRYTGSQATAVLGQLGIEAPAYEIKAGCSTSLTSLHFAHALLMQGYPDVLVACGETLSKLIHPGVRETWFGLADGAGALWLKRQPGGRIRVQRSFYSTDGRAVDLFTTRGELPPTQAAFDAGDYYLQGDGQELMRQALTRYGQVIEALRPGPLRWLLPHQVNRKIIQQVMETQGLKAEVLWDADKVGNIGGSSIMYSLANALKKDALNGGGEMLLMSVGGGLSFAGQIWTWR
jgi:3-oxoacyl-[acyl-carrier-protein] synthase-3